MGWFSDYGQTASLEDLDAAAAQARATLASVAKSGRWPSSWSAQVEALIAREAEDADGWFSDDVPAFWRELATGMDTIAASGVVVPDRWTKLRNVYATAGGAAETVEQGREAGSVSTVIGGAASRTAGDVAEVAGAAGSAVSTTVSVFKRPAAWVLLALVIGGIALKRR